VVYGFFLGPICKAPEGFCPTVTVDSSSDMKEMVMFTGKLDALFICDKCESRSGARQQGGSGEQSNEAVLASKTTIWSLERGSDAVLASKQ
jgi:hypothetical protein